MGLQQGTGSHCHAHRFCTPQATASSVAGVPLMGDQSWLLAGLPVPSQAPPPPHGCLKSKWPCLKAQEQALPHQMQLLHHPAGKAGSNIIRLAT